jgi:CheY-like chemotaxis protein
LPRYDKEYKRLTMITALVIDDNQEAADTICQMLSLLNVQAYPAYGPRAAMLALKKITPDVVFLDVNMPGVDGFEVLAYLRRFPVLAKTPVVIVTSDDQPETAGKARKTGALLLILKPVTIESMEGALKKAGLI